MPSIKPIRPRFHLEVLSATQREAIKSATLRVLEQTGVKFPSERALRVFAEHGAWVDMATQIVRLPPDLVLEAMGRAPRSYVLTGRAEGTDLTLDGTCSYFGTDGCGTETLDFTTGERRPSCKEDVARMARVVDYLPSVAFYWPMVSAQDCGRLAPLHELDASFNSTAKHVQTETVMGARPAQYALRMGEVIAGDRERMRARPPFSVLICTIAPLGQDKEGIEAGMVYAEAGIPVGFMAMPNMGSTAPAVPGGALVVGNAEVVSALVLMQLVAPGAPVFHSILASVMNPRTAEYIVSTPEKYLCNAAAVHMAHDWGVPSLAGGFGVDAAEPASWQLGRDSVYSALMCTLAGTDMSVGLGMLGASTLLAPEQIIFDDEIYHTHRILAEGIDTSSDGLALDVIAKVGPRGHFLAQKHTRRHIQDLWIPELTHPRQPLDGTPMPGIQPRAKAKLDSILAEHQPQPLEEAAQAELRTILEAAAQELGS
ncbi:MAG: trimethylamine methyltransferase family protein [Anaerolineales bacterium]|nr:MAG: trimethylamine methyltransferase family protein [Anaerolineales bacterium]